MAVAPRGRPCRWRPAAGPLQNWEQGHRRPEGTARALLRVAESHPQAVLEALHR